MVQVDQRAIDGKSISNYKYGIHILNAKKIFKLSVNAEDEDLVKWDMKIKDEYEGKGDNFYFNFNTRVIGWKLHKRYKGQLFNLKNEVVSRLYSKISEYK